MAGQEPGLGDEEWRGLDDEALGRRLIERWLYRGMMLGIIFLAAIIVSWLASRGGLETMADRVTVGVLLLLALTAAAVAFVMRLQDLRIHRELRRRRQPP
jgi:hypothetical protein